MKYKKLSKHSILLLIAAIVLFCLFFALVFVKEPIYTLDFYSVKNNKVVKSININPGDKFVIKFIHSFYKTPILDTFVINEQNKIILMETEYTWEANGLQDAYPLRGVWGYKNGNVCISNIFDIFDEIPLRVGTIANHQLIYKEDIVDFLSFADGGELIKIKVRKHHTLF